MYWLGRETGEYTKGGETGGVMDVILRMRERKHNGVKDVCLVRVSSTEKHRRFGGDRLIKSPRR
jgi:hypothetical protein